MRYAAAGGAMKPVMAPSMLLMPKMVPANCGAMSIGLTRKELYTAPCSVAPMVSSATARVVCVQLTKPSDTRKMQAPNSAERKARRERVTAAREWSVSADQNSIRLRSTGKVRACRCEQ